MDFDVAASAKVIAVFDYVEDLFVLLLDLNAYLINFESLYSLVQVCQWVKVVSLSIQVLGLFSELMSLSNLPLLKLNDLLAE